REAQHVHFPIDCTIADTLSTHNGISMEMMITGYEGADGLLEVLARTPMGHRTQVVVPGPTLKVPAARFLEVFAALPLPNHFTRYMSARVIMASQISACNRSHSILQRLARRIAMAHDRVQGDQIPMTH